MAGIRCSLLIGREREVAELSELVSRTAAGRGGSAFVTGEAGIGKSRLLAMAADVARSRGMAVLQGRVSPSPVPTPYRPFAEAFAAGLRGRELDGDRSLARFRSALAMLAPGRFDPEAGQPRANPSIVLLGEATIALLERCAEGRGALLLLEDLQWAGEETCELIDYLSDKLDDLGIAMVASVRTGEGSAAERLYLSVRTVEKHVERLLAKAASANRAQLVAFAHRSTSTT
jgi:predicted ATPase